jgi:endogenous inhibitor of DNA gyrase (YacG/DUF329 family)
MAKAVCPICKKECARYPENPVFPFCGKQCKLADLGNWLDGRYAVPDASAGPNEDELDSDGELEH